MCSHLFSLCLIYLCYSFHRDTYCLRKAVYHWIPARQVSLIIFFLLNCFVVYVVYISHLSIIFPNTFLCLCLSVVPQPGRHRRPMTAPRTQKGKVIQWKRVLLIILTVVLFLAILAIAIYFSEFLTCTHTHTHNYKLLFDMFDYPVSDLNFRKIFFFYFIEWKLTFLQWSKVCSSAFCGFESHPFLCFNYSNKYFSNLKVGFTQS